ncbi:hypothetical protein ACP70R_019658 [Stipagrostis hirtigluma subsp. patula]
MSAGSGTPWKGRLRSHHETAPSLPSRRRPSRAKNREEAQASQKRAAATKNTGRGGSRGEDAGDARQPRAPTRRSPRLAGGDAEHPIVIDGADEECEVRHNQSAITPLRRSARLDQDDKSSGKPLSSPNAQQIAHNRKTRAASKKQKDQENQRRNPRNAAVKPSPRMKCHKEPQALCQNSQDIPPSRKIADVPRTRSKSQKQELKPSGCKVLTRKRKIGTEGRFSSKRQCYQEPKLSTPDRKEIAPSNETRKPADKKSKKDYSSPVQPEIGDERLMNIGVNNEDLSGIGREGLDHWTEEQDMALRQAYFTARPSPHFWKRVSKMVPGKSTEECFNRIHADLSTPTPIAPRPRTCKAKFSPLANFSLSDSKLPNLLEPTVGRQRTSKQKSLAARKTVRHLLQKHCRTDQAQEADHFSIFETSPSALQLNMTFEDSPGTPVMNSGSSRKCSGSSSARKKPFSRLKSNQAEPSPAVLKPVKNVALHDKYIDQLSRREGTKRPRKRTSGSGAAGSKKPVSELQAGNLKAAKNALISEATDFIRHFKKLQANSLAHIVENSEDDEIDAECNGHDDDE